MLRRRVGNERARRALPATRQQMGRLERWLTYGTSYIAVTGHDIERVSTAVNLAAETLDKYEVVSISLSERSAEAVVARGPQDRSLGGDPLAVAKELISSIRTTTKSVLVVIEDADLASIDRLESLRIALEAERVDGPTPRMVLCGTSALSRVLELSRARALASRVGHRLDIDR